MPLQIPAAFRDIIGHQHIVGLLTGAVARESLPPSLIFSGPSGIGKAAVAAALAHLLNCEHVDQATMRSPACVADACGECPSCRRLTKAMQWVRAGGARLAVDCLQWLAPDDRDSIKIEPVRDVLGRAAYRPFDGRRRLVVIDDADALEIPAQHALLKMLEEPPSATVFVLITSRPHVLLATVRSRCPQLRFAPLGPREIAQALVDRYGWSPPDAAVAAATADGRLAVALIRGSAVDGGPRDVAVEVLERAVRGRGPGEKLEAAQLLVARSEGSKAKGGTKKASTVATRHDVMARLDAMLALLRDIGVLASGASEHCLVQVDLAPRLSRLIQPFVGDRLTSAFDAVDRARAALDRNASQKVVADWLVMRL